MNNKKKIIESFNNLRNYCEKEEFKGWDPYDGLNSELFQAIPFFRNSRFFRLAWIQLFKRNPINLRKLLLIEKDYNPKGLGLFLSGYCKLYNKTKDIELLSKIKFLTNEIINLKSEGNWSGSCWGYNFDWQARAFFQPKYTPTVVATTFIGYALIEAYELLKDKKILDTVLSIPDFILKDLNRTYDDDGNFSFSYSPLDKTQVFNASLLGSSILSKIYTITGEQNLIIEAKKSVQFCINHQNEKDGSWSYGTLPFHKWVDNFHTGYNLECISNYQKYSGDNSYNRNIEIGFDYYINTFFTKDGKSKYYNNSLYPIDIHAPAQLVATLSSLDKLTVNSDLVEKVLKWTIINMQDIEGYFYYQQKKSLNSKIPYIRWAQAWMFYSMSIYLSNTESGKDKLRKEY